MAFPTIPHLKELLAERKGPCVSLYMPTLRALPPAAENPRRLESLIQRAEEQLRRKYAGSDIDEMLGRLHKLQRTTPFWEEPTDGVAIFASATTFRVLRLQRTVQELVEVGESFHLKPLIRAMQFTGGFQVLCLSQTRVRLLEGTQDRLEKVELRHVPRTPAEALGANLSQTEGPRQVERGRRIPVGSAQEVQDLNDNTLDHFLRLVDRAVWDHHSRDAGLPMILCAVERYHDRFRRISKNSNLALEGIRLNPDGVSVERIHQEAWAIIEPGYRAQIDKVLDDYGLAESRQLGSDDLAQVAEAAAQARVGTLLVDADQHVGGRMDPQSGRVEFVDFTQPDMDDLLDDIAERVIKTGGQVLVMPHEHMPTETGVAAIYRF